MKVFINLPELEEDKEELENRVANFRATLLIEKIRELNIRDSSKKKLLDLILKDMDKNSVLEKWKIVDSGTPQDIIAKYDNKEILIEDLTT